MRASRMLFVMVVLTCLYASGLWADTCSSRGLNMPAGPMGNPALEAQVDAAALVETVRAGERWIHETDTLFVRMESVWSKASVAGVPSSQPCDRILKNDAACSEKPLVVASRGWLEYAVDRNRLRFLDDQPGRSRVLKIWDGKQFLAHETPARGRERYFLDYTPQGHLIDIFGSETSWPRAQPHSFWWDVKDVDELSAYYGRPSEFRCAAQQDYRGIECYVLQLYPTEVRAVLHGQSYQRDAGMDDHQEHGFIGEVRGLANQSCRWYVGVEDGLLHGVLWSIADRPRLEHWMLDYRQVAPGRWYPMTQGYQIYEKDSLGRTYIDARRDLKVLEIRLNEALSDDLFQLELKEGIRVEDRRRGRLVTYEYRPKPPQLLGKPLPALASSFANLDTAPLEAKPVLLCFFDMQQRPSRHCLRELAEQTHRLEGMGIAIVAVQAAEVEESVMRRWTAGSEIPFPVVRVAGDAEKTRFAWNVNSLPWLVLSDRGHIVKAAGFPVRDLDTKLADALGNSEQWAHVAP